MRRIHFAVVDVVDARPEITWDILTDYRDAHPRILPNAYFRDFRVERGGHGAGTVVSFVFRAARATRHLRQIVSEPEPWRVLVESDVDGTGATTFTLTPVDEGRRTRVRIDTVAEGHGGVMGMVERLMLPTMTRVMERVYREELSLLSQVAQAWTAAPARAEWAE
jgi:hypothetical protein